MKMTDRERLWRTIREEAQSYEAPDHLSDSQLRNIAVRLSAGIAPILEDQEVLGPLPEWAE